jgi:flagellar motor switch protein FliG
MADDSGEQTVTLLLRLLPSDTAEAVLQHLPSELVSRLRRRLQATDAGQVPPAELDAALTQFFDLWRLAQRYPQLSTSSSTAVAAEPAAATSAPSVSDDPLQQLRSYPPQVLARALHQEPPAVIALILATLEPAAAGQVLARLPGSLRPEIAVRLARTATPQPALLRNLACALIDKCRQLAELPLPASPEAMVAQLVGMLRALPRPERMPVVRQMETIDPDLAAKVLADLTRLEDLLKIPDRQMQTLLTKLDMKTLATALKNAPEAVRNKVAANLSTRARQVLQEEMEFLGDVPASRIKEAQSRVLAAVVKAEEAGEIVIEEQ